MTGLDQERPSNMDFKELASRAFQLERAHRADHRCESMGSGCEGLQAVRAVRQAAQTLAGHESLVASILAETR
jgi:hypothetical protein